MPNEQDVYDAVAYPGYAYLATHPDRLAVMGMLHGLDPAPVERCRVLEIACSEGANLIPMAYAIPGSEFVGFDLAGLPVVRGQQRIRELGLKNIRLFQADLMQVGSDGDGPDGQRLGTFDYIIAHGLYAWVPEPVRDRLLALCRKHLTPNGIAFISYNALPGGHARNLVREIVLHGFSRDEDPAQSVRRGLDVLDFIAECRPQGDPFRALLEKEAEKLRSKRPEVIYHDELAPHYRLVSFSSFIAHAGQHGLQYVSESVLPPPNDVCFQPRIAQMAKALAGFDSDGNGGDRIAEEQFLDLARMRVYRETLLCHAERESIGDLRLDAFARLRLASPAQSSPGTDADFKSLRVYTVPGGAEMKSQHQTTMDVMEYLIHAWPESVPWPELEKFLDAKGIALDAELMKLLMQLVVARMIELHAWAAPVSRTIAERPRASEVSRQEASVLDRMTTLLHDVLRLEDPLVRRFLGLLDGSRDRGALLQVLRAEYPETPDAKLAEGIEPALHVLHRAGVLLAEDFG